MRTKTVLLVTIWVLMSGLSTWAQTQKDVLKALILMNNKMEAGIGQREYPSALADLATELQLFEGTPEAKQAPQFTAAAREAVDHYRVLGVAIAAAYRGVLSSNDDRRAFNQVVDAYSKIRVVNSPATGARLIDVGDVARAAMARAQEATRQAQASLGR